MDSETDAELIARQKQVAKLVAATMRQLERMKPGGTRDDKSRFIGSLNFTLSQIQSKIEERGVALLEGKPVRHPLDRYDHPHQTGDR